MVACRSCGIKIMGSLAICSVVANPGDARQDPAELCDQAAEQAAARSAVPLQVLLAITRVETGRHADGQLRPWPWAINLSGQGYWFPDLREALDFANLQLAQGVANFDVGCFQINLHWHGDAFDSLEQAMDPSANATYAAEFLANLHHSEGGWPEAVAAYHSRTPDKAKTYLQKVEIVLADLKKDSTAKAPIQFDETPRDNRFPLLQMGKKSGASLVPHFGLAIPFIGGN